MSPTREEVEHFKNSVNSGDDAEVERLIEDMPADVLRIAYRLALYNVKNTGDDEGGYHTTLQIIRDEMSKKNLTMKKA